MLKVHLLVRLPLWAPFAFMGPLTCMGPFRFRMALLHLYRAFTTTWGPFTPVRPHPVGGFGGTCAGCENFTGIFSSKDASLVKKFS